MTVLIGAYLLLWFRGHLEDRRNARALDAEAAGMRELKRRLDLDED